ncbi:MAG TPA: iron-sulfur cluster assembly accessory protein [Gemmatimonadales bacterium]|nr:iron-sulfur cluster assembly accessory protein [Gemmatimonadales bacterium]
MVNTTQTAGVNLRLTGAAVAKAREAIAAETDMPAETIGLRVAVMPGGCSGFKYEMSVDAAPQSDDLILDIEGIRVFVDQFSAQYLNGTTIDYISTMQQSGFAFDNPNATGGCGCGTSFSV